jgi:predicted small lipoprotein YifL
MLPAGFRQQLSSAVTLAVVLALAGCNLPGRLPDPTAEKILPPTPAVEDTAAPAEPATETLPATAEPTATSTATATPEPTATATPQPLPPAIPLIGAHVIGLNAPGEVELARQGGVYWTRFDDFHWSAIEPQRADPPEYFWRTVAENHLLNAVEAGFNVIGIVQYAPYWAQQYPGFACGPVKPEEYARFGVFIADLVRRYSAPPFNIQYWEIGNEPDVDRNLVGGSSGFGCWGEKGQPLYGGQAYGEMLKVVYPMIKAANPQAQVLVGGLLLECDPVNPPETALNSGVLRDCSPATFIEGILEAGGGAGFDGISFHAYDFYAREYGKYGNRAWHSLWNTTGPVLTAKVRYLRSLLEKYGVSGKYLINTEVALLCGRSGFEGYCLNDDYEKTKAYYAAEALAAAQAEGLVGNIWYYFAGGWRGSGLVNSGRRELPAFQASRFSRQMLEQAAYIQPYAGVEGVIGYEFRRAGKRLLFVWSLDGAEHSLALDSPPAAVYDVFGNLLEASQTLTLTVAPLYIELAP